MRWNRKTNSRQELSSTDQRCQHKLLGRFPSRWACRRIAIKGRLYYLLQGLCCRKAVIWNQSQADASSREALALVS